MAIDKLIPRYLNKDDDYLLVKSVEMVDALNVQMSDDEGGNAGVIKNALGNVLVSSAASGDVLPAGTNTVIGTTACKQTGEIFYFVHNSSNNHSIYQYTSRRNTVRLVYRDSVLGFTATGFVKADCLVKENGDTLLYFTDGVTDPKKINATKALANASGVNGYPIKRAGSYNYTDSQKLLSITSIKAPPVNPLAVTVSSDTSFTENNVFGRLFQFAYQYVYQDGEVSAISPYSELALNELYFVDGFFAPADDNPFNAIRVVFDYSPADVSKIRILVREGTLNNFNIFTEVDNVVSGFTNFSILGTPTGSVLFTNKSLLVSVSDNEMNKLYDSIPLSSESQTISGNRLAYANYTESFDNTPITGSIYFSSEKTSTTYPSLSTTTTGYTATTIVSTPSTEANLVFFNIKTDLFPESAGNGYVLNLNLSVKADSLTLKSPEPQYKLTSTTLSGTTTRVFVNSVYADPSGTLFRVIRRNALDSLPTWQFKVQPLDFGGAPLPVTGTYTLSSGLGPATLNVTQYSSGTVHTSPEILVPTHKSRGPVNTYQVNLETANASGFNDLPLAVTGLVLGSTSIEIDKRVLFPSGYTNREELCSGIISALSGLTFNASCAPDKLSYSSAPDDAGSVIQYYFGGRLQVNLVSPSIFSSGSTLEYRVRPVSGSLNADTSKVLIKRVGQSPTDVTINAVPLVFRNKTLRHTFDTVWSNFRLTGTSGSFGIGVNDYKTFKSGQYHKFGIVYYDQYNRSSSVNPIGAQYAKTEGEKGFSGRNKCYLRINNSPPSWAKKWQIVYSPYTNYSFSYRYSVAEAFLAANTDTTTSTPTGSVSNKSIFLSMRHLEGKDSSYKETENANINYSYAKGDKVRVVSYNDAAGGNNLVFPKNLIFNVLGYEYISSTGTLLVTGVATTNMSATTNRDFRSTGLFLELENEDYPGFNTKEISATTSLWGSDCVIEIFRPNKLLGSEIYREISTYGDVITSGASYFHKTNERDYSYTLPTGVTITTGSGLIEVSSSGIPIYPGDGLLLQAGSSPEFVCNVIDVIRFGTKLYLNTDNSLNQSVTQVYSFVALGVYNTPAGGLISYPDNAIISTSNGDAYYRPRKIKFNPLNPSTSVPTPSNADDIRYQTMFVEDTSVSDFYESNFISIGRPNAESKNAKQIERKSSITYSEPYSLDTSVLKLSSFNGGQGNFVDLPNSYGAIKQMLNNGDSITVLQEVKSSLIPINRNLVEYLDGTSNVTVSTNYLGSQSVYAGSYGTQNPESVKEHNGRVYFSDVRSGKIVRIGPDGLEPISENKIDAYTQDKCFIIASSTGTYKTIGGIDPMHGEYDITYLTVSGGPNIDDTIAYDMEDKVWNTRYSYLPEAYEHLDNFLYTFKGGAMYRHTESAPALRNTFYGSGYTSSIKLISAFNNSMVKTAEAFSIEGNAPWSFKFSLSGQTARETVTVATGSLSLRESMYYASVPRLNASSSQAVSNRAVIGYITATGIWASGVTLTIGNPITTPFQASGNTFIGALSGTTMTIYDGTNGYALIQASGTNTILLSNLSGSIAAIPTGTILVADSPAFIDGDPVRGPFFIIDATNSANTPIEAYAFNVYFTRSRLHNELVTE